jgi:hypothetical protein
MHAACLLKALAVATPSYSYSQLYSAVQQQAADALLPQALLHYYMPSNAWQTCP